MSYERPAPAPASHWEPAVRAVIRGDVEGLGMHLAAEPDLITGRGTEGMTLLGEAARAVTQDNAIPSRDAGEGHHAVVARLLAAGADPSAPDPNGWTPLHSAGVSGNPRLAQTLLDAGARTDALVEGRAGSTPLGYALFYAHLKTAEMIAGDRPVPDDLRNAAGLGDLARLHRWLDGGRPLPSGADAGMAFSVLGPREESVNDQVVIDESLGWASRCGRIEAMELLVANGADVNTTRYRGTPLLWAVYSDRVEAAEWLLDHGADPDLRHDFGGKEHGVRAVAMHLAAQYGSIGCLQVLLERGADAAITDGAYESTPLGWARYGEQPEAVALLERHHCGSPRDEQ